MSYANPEMAELDLDYYRNVGQVPIYNYNIDVRRYNQQRLAFDQLWSAALKKQERRENIPMIAAAVVGIFVFIIYVSNADGDLGGAFGVSFLAGIVSAVLFTWITSTMIKPTDELADHPVNLLKKSLIKRKNDYDQVEKIALQRYMRTQQNYWLKLSGWQFEKEIGSIYSKLGYQVIVTRGSGDGGVDLILTKSGTKYLVQCKNHNKPVGPAGVRDLFGAMHHEKAMYGIFISSTGYTRGAKEFAAGKNIQMLDLNDVIKMNAQV